MTTSCDEWCKHLHHPPQAEYIVEKQASRRRSHFWSIVQSFSVITIPR